MTLTDKIAELLQNGAKSPAYDYTGEDMELVIEGWLEIGRLLTNQVYADNNPVRDAVLTVQAAYDNAFDRRGVRSQIAFK